MKKYLLTLISVFFIAQAAFCEPAINEAFGLLKARKDKQALKIFEEILAKQPNNVDAIWGKGEVKRRKYEVREAEELFNEALKKDANYAPALISLAYIRSKEDKLDQALKIINKVLKLKDKSISRENRGMAYMVLGSINSRRSTGGLLSKVAYGTQIKGNLLKAKELAPDCAEVHLALGTFYLKAPGIVGGNIDEALKELEIADKLAPNFSTVQGRLAQVYQKLGNKEKFEYYLKRTKELDMRNETLTEICSTLKTTP